MQKRYDLGNATSATDANTIDHSFQNLINMPSRPCIYCRQPSTHKLVPLSGSYPNAYEEDNAYTCSFCLRHVNRAIYTPKEMR